MKDHSQLSEKTDFPTREAEMKALTNAIKRHDKSNMKDAKHNRWVGLLSAMRIQRNFYRDEVTRLRSMLNEAMSHD